MYKIVTKIIVSRLRPILGNLVSPFQVAFVLGRRVLTMSLLLKSLFTLFREKRVGLVSLSLSLIWRKLMIDLNGISFVKF